MEPTSKDIISKLRIDELLPEEQEELLNDLDELIFKATLVRLIENMDEETQDAFNLLLEKDTGEEEIDSFLKEKVPNADQLMQEAMTEITSDILAVTK